MTINSKLYCYLRPEAKRAFDDFVRLGADEDLAFALVEELGGEDIFNLDTEDEEIDNGIN